MLLIGSAWAQEPDYKQLYLEQRIIAIQMELQEIQLRFKQLRQELPMVQKELKLYRIEKAKKEEKKK